MSAEAPVIVVKELENKNFMELLQSLRHMFVVLALHVT